MTKTGRKADASFPKKEARFLFGGRAAGHCEAMACFGPLHGSKGITEGTARSSTKQSERESESDHAHFVFSSLTLTLTLYSGYFQFGV